jgi:hypothetical protein
MLIYGIIYSITNSFYKKYDIYRDNLALVWIEFLIKCHIIIIIIIIIIIVVLKLLLIVWNIIE